MKREHRSAQCYSAVPVCVFNVPKRVRVPAQTTVIPINCLVSHRERFRKSSVRRRKVAQSHHASSV
jgi:hypothetical protein